MDPLAIVRYPEIVARFHELRSYSVRPSSTDSAWAFSYERFSSPAQADGDSLRRQNALHQGWLKRHPQVRLDQSLRMSDRGVSGFSDDLWTNPKHAWCQFVRAVERSRVPAGSYLLIENLDRLARTNPLHSIPAILGLIAKGIRIVQLAPTEIVFDPEMGMDKLFLMVMNLCRGHDESTTKSRRVGEAWAEKKQQARQAKTPHGQAIPDWLELTDDGYRVIEPKAASIRRLLRWSLEGLGAKQLTRRLLAEKVPPVSRSGRWTRSYVTRLLKNRALIGEYQPHRGHARRTPEGEPIPNYYPKVLEESEWYTIQAAKQARQNRSGRPATAQPSLHVFSGLLRCARQGCGLNVVWGGGLASEKGRRAKYLFSYDANNGQTAEKGVGFPLEVFVEHLVRRLRELQAADLFADPTAVRIGELDGRLTEILRRKRVAQVQWDADPESPTWQEEVTRFCREERALAKELLEVKQRAAHPLSATWTEAINRLWEQEPERLRAALLQTVQGIWCLFVARQQVRLAAVQVWFSGGAHREYFLWYQQPNRWRNADWESGTLAEVMGNTAQNLDLRRPADARKLEKFLQIMDLELKPR